MGILHTSCVRECTNRDQNSNQELQVIQNQQIQKIQHHLLNEYETSKTTLKGTSQLSDSEKFMEIKEEDQSSNFKINPVPAFVLNKQLHQFIVPKRENRFIQDIEYEVKQKIKEIQNKEKCQALQLKYSKINDQQQPQKFDKCSSNVLNYSNKQHDSLKNEYKIENHAQNESKSNLNYLQSSSLVIEKLQSTQLECISAPNKEIRGILKSDSLKKQSNSVDVKSVNSNKRVHFSEDIKIDSEDLLYKFKWRNFRIA
ncbi:unnamed protein product [Paramecium pentaurelia]|uniref:Uncharacterized protein n=1 Tax=Paramecium pentaurelia TaxID=43138 RepID=A0A8S1V159_9CILI|nr:unnamed protein product [Paramecium pentaurelia]